MTHPATRTVTGMISVLLWLLAAAAWSAPLKSVQELLADAGELLEAQAREAYPNGEVEARMQSLDPRLDLPPCQDAELIPRGQQHHGRIPVAVRCRNPQAWSIFLTGDVTVSVPVVVAARPIRRGDLIGPTTVTVTKLDLAGVRGLFYSDPAAVIGKEARRNLAEADVVLATQLAEPAAVERGNKVTIVARHGPVRIKSAGEALGDGRIGAQVRVRNLDSGRIVHGWVESQGTVVTTPGATAQARASADGR